MTSPVDHLAAAERLLEHAGEQTPEGQTAHALRALAHLGAAVLALELE